MELTNKYNSLDYFKQKEYLKTLLKNTKDKIAKLEKENGREQIKWIQELNKIYDEDETVTMWELADKYDVSYFKINRNIWKPRLKGRSVKA